MISAIVYLINSVILGILAYKSYLMGYGKGAKNPFGVNFFWFSSIVSLSMFKSALIIVLAEYYANFELLFWGDFFGRILYYIAALFSIQILSYAISQSDKKRILFLVPTALLGTVLVFYQIFFRNIPHISESEIVNWGAGYLLGGGMFLMLTPVWAAISFVFLRNYVKSRYKNVRSLFLGSGFILFNIGGIFQDLSVTVFSYIAFSIVLAIGYLLCLAGMFYEES